MAGRKKENFDRPRVEFKADPAWIRRAHDTATRLGFGNLSDFIRFAVTQYIDHVSVERGFPEKTAEPKPRRKDQ